MSAEKESFSSLRAFAVDAPSEVAQPIIDLERSDPGLAVPVRRVPLFAKLVFGIVIGSCVVVLGLCAQAVYADRSLRHHAHAAAAPVPVPVPAPAPAPVPVAAPAPAPVPAPEPVIASSEKPGPPPVETKSPTATIRRSKKTRTLTIDGKTVKADSVEVSCGPHLVAVDKEKPRRVEAVCGRVLLVDKKKATLLPARVSPSRRPRDRSPT